MINSNLSENIMCTQSSFSLNKRCRVSSVSPEHLLNGKHCLLTFHYLTESIDFHHDRKVHVFTAEFPLNAADIRERTKSHVRTVS